MNDRPARRRWPARSRAGSERARIDPGVAVVILGTLHVRHEGYLIGGEDLRGATEERLDERARRMGEDGVGVDEFDLGGEDLEVSVVVVGEVRAFLTSRMARPRSSSTAALMSHRFRVDAVVPVGQQVRKEEAV